MFEYTTFYLEILLINYTLSPFPYFPPPVVGDVLFNGIEVGYGEYECSPGIIFRNGARQNVLPDHLLHLLRPPNIKRE